MSSVKHKAAIGFFKGLFFFMLLIFILDFGIGKTLKYFYFKQYTGSLYELTYLLDSIRSDIVVFGASTATHHFEPSSFENRLGMTFYNAGFNGTSIFHHYAFLQGTLRNHHPKVVILAANAGDFKKSNLSYERLYLLLPYYDSHPFLRPIIELKSPLEKLKLLSRIYPYNSTIFTTIIRNPVFADYNLKRKEDVQGYIPLNRNWRKPIEEEANNENYEIDTNKVKMFKSFIEECKQSSVNLYIVTSPRFVREKKEDASVRIMEKIASDSGVRLINLYKDSVFENHIEYFADKIHLNPTGATVVSNLTIDEILKDTNFKRSSH